jgi:hypothetical protein
MKLTNIVAAIAVAWFATAVSAQTQDYSFGTGDFNGWTTGPTSSTQSGDYTGNGIGAATVTGEQTVSCCGSNVWKVSPYTGSYMVSLQPGSQANYSTMTSALGLSSTSISALNTEINAQGTGQITGGAWITKNFTFTAPATFKMAWNYISTDYVPFNDGSLTSLVNTTNATEFGKINGVSKEYLLLGATNPGTGNYSTGSYGSTGWQWVNYEIVTAGTYKLGFSAFNQGDTALSPVLFVNDGLGTTTVNGTAFNPVAPNDPTMPTTNPDGSVSTGGGTPTVTGTTTTDTVTTTTTNGTPTVAYGIAYGATVTVLDLANSRGGQTAQKLTVTQTATNTATTPFTLTTTTTTPVTTTTTTTPVTTTTYSDGTTTTTNGTATVTTTTTDTVSSVDTQGEELLQIQTQKDYSTRVDQYSNLSNSNNRMNESLESDPWTRVRVDAGQISQRSFAGRDWNFYVTGSGLKTSTRDTYSSTGSTFGVGIERLVSKSLLIGAQYNRGQINMSGDAAGGSLNKDAVGAYVLKTFDTDVVIKGDLGYAQNNYNTAHSIPELALSNTSSAAGRDTWAQVKVYTPAVKGIRAFAGGRTETNQINAVTESGSAVSAMTYGAVNQTRNSGIGGVRYDYNFNKKFAMGSEVQYSTANVSTGSVNLTYHDTKNSSVLLKVARQQYQGQNTNIAMLQARVNF